MWTGPDSGPHMEVVWATVCLFLWLTDFCLSDWLPVSLQFILQQVDISLPENRMWLDRYKWDIPVFHLNGQFVMKHGVDVILLDKLLQDAETQETWKTWSMTNTINKFLFTMWNQDVDVVDVWCCNLRSQWYLSKWICYVHLSGSHSWGWLVMSQSWDLKD